MAPPEELGPVTVEVPEEMPAIVKDIIKVCALVVLGVTAAWALILITRPL